MNFFFDKVGKTYGEHSIKMYYVSHKQKMFYTFLFLISINKSKIKYYNTWKILI